MWLVYVGVPTLESQITEPSQTFYTPDMGLRQAIKQPDIALFTCKRPTRRQRPLPLNMEKFIGQGEILTQGDLGFLSIAKYDSAYLGAVGRAKIPDLKAVRAQIRDHGVLAADVFGSTDPRPAMWRAPNDHAANRRAQTRTVPVTHDAESGNPLHATGRSRVPQQIGVIHTSNMGGSGGGASQSRRLQGTCRTGTAPAIVRGDDTETTGLKRVDDLVGGQCHKRVECRALLIIRLAWLCRGLLDGIAGISLKTLRQPLVVFERRKIRCRRTKSSVTSVIAESSGLTKCTLDPSERNLNS